MVFFELLPFLKAAFTACGYSFRGDSWVATKDER